MLHAMLVTAALAASACETAWVTTSIERRVSGFLRRRLRGRSGRVWRALTDLEIVPRWTSSGHGGRPVGFVAEVGTVFNSSRSPCPGRTPRVVDCEVLEAREPSLLRYSWRGDADGDVTMVTIRVERHEAGARLTWEHAGFTGVGGSS